MNKIIDTPNLLFFMDEIIRISMHSFETIHVNWQQSHITVWHHNEDYRCGCEMVTIALGDSIDSAYDTLDKLKIASNGGFLNE